ncbi:uncharacterized protein LOC134663986 [Cydia fagiglandana]|uniref:uncharacterized protein LOC134663986 n=1 Tax=Cydia fagiglandana TaxID=1458189 RepID=UPI002FEE63E1
MQLPETAPPPLAPLWDRVLRARALPPDLDVELLYVAIRDRLTHPEWEVRLHALRVLADLLPLSGNALTFPFDQVIDNLGHGSPNVRKAALDALKVFCSHCEDPECAARAILDKCSYHNIRPHSADFDTKVNVITGLILSIPSVMAILKRRHPVLDTFPIFQTLGDKLFDHVHRDVALRSLIKLRRVVGPRDYMIYLSRLEPKVQDKFRILCEVYDEDSLDVYYAPRKTTYRDKNSHHLVKINHVFNSPVRLSTCDTSSEDSYNHVPYYGNNYAKVIIETEIKFDSDTAITMTVLEENETESEKNTGSEEDCDSSDRNMLKYSDGDSEDMDVVVKKVRFGGESVKIRTPDSENIATSEDDTTQNKPAAILQHSHIEEASMQVTPLIVSKMNEIKREAFERESQSKPKKSGIPLPVINNKPRNPTIEATYSKVKLKSKSLSELYDYFRSKNEAPEDNLKNSGFTLTLTEIRTPDKLPSPVEPHREVEVLHNLQRSPTVSPRRRSTRLHLEQDGFVLSLLASSPPKEEDYLSPREPSPLRGHYQWEDLGVVPKHVSDQLHNTENWIAAVKAADQLHSALLDAENVRRAEPAALSLVQHMWALSEEVSAARAPAEGAVCALLRGASKDCVRQLLPALVARMGREPPPTALPHAMLQSIPLHNLIDVIFEPAVIGISGDTERMQSTQLRAALCLARAAGPAAVLTAVRRRLADTARADVFCNKLRERLSKPVENRLSHVSRSSLLPVPVRRRARSTPSPAAPPPPRRLRPLPDSAPLPSISQANGESLHKALSPIPLSDKDSSALTATCEDVTEEKKISSESLIFGETTIVDIPVDEIDNAPPAPHSPSIHVEDYSEKSIKSVESQNENSLKDNNSLQSNDDFGSQKSLSNERAESPLSRPQSRISSPSPVSARSRSESASPIKSGQRSPDPTSNVYNQQPACERDVRSALTECIVPAKHEDWEVIVNALTEAERLASDSGARAPAASWRAVVRSTATHVKSLRSRVARTACSTMGALFEHRGRSLDPELEDAATALLERCADVNRFLRADAASALVRVACGSSSARAAVALARRGAAHRAGPVRAATAQALTRLVERRGAARMLDLPAEPRTLLLRAAGELLGDACAEARLHARLLCLALLEDTRFRPMLKESMQPTRYRAIQKFVDKLR